MGIFSQFGSYLSDLVKILSYREFPIEFWKSSGFGVRVRTSDTNSGSGHESYW